MNPEPTTNASRKQVHGLTHGRTSARGRGFRDGPTSRPVRVGLLATWPAYSVERKSHTHRERVDSARVANRNTTGRDCSVSEVKSERDALAREIWLADRLRACAPGGPSEQDYRAADRLIAAGCRRPRTICYVILDGDASPQARYATMRDAEQVRDAWIAAHESAGVPYSFRIAEIVEAAA